MAGWPIHTTINGDMPVDFTLKTILGPSSTSGAGNSKPVSGLAAEIKALLAPLHTNWVKAACVLIADSHNWPTKEQLLLQGIIDCSGRDRPPRTLNDFNPFIHLTAANKDSEGGTPLVKLYTALGEVLTIIWWWSVGGDLRRMDETGLANYQEDWNYFVLAREIINSKLRLAGEQRGVEYKLIPSDPEINLHVSPLIQRPSSFFPNFDLPPLCAAHCVTPSTFARARPFNESQRLVSRTYQLLKLIPGGLAVQDSHGVAERPTIFLDWWQAAFFRARIAAHGVDVWGEPLTQRWLIFEITNSSPKGREMFEFQAAYSTASDFVLGIVSPPEVSPEIPLRTLNILIGTQERCIPVCQLDNGVLTTPDNKKYIYPANYTIPQQAAQYGWRMRTPEGGEKIYLVFAEEIHVYTPRAANLDPADKKLFDSFARKIKEAVASDDLLHLWPVKSYSHSVSGLQVVARALRDKKKVGLQWLLDHPECFNRNQEFMDLVGNTTSIYSQAVRWFRDNKKFNGKLTPA